MNPYPLYTALWHLALPGVMARLWWKGRRFPEERRRLWERLGHLPPLPRGGVWFHAVSVGEVHAVAPLIRALARPGIITTATYTGAQRAQAALKMPHVYAPFDLPSAVGAFLDALQPQLLVLTERELWPNLIRGCRERGVPVAVVNARLSTRSLKRYQRLPGFSSRMFSQVSAWAAQTEADAERLAALGAREVTVTGNLKFDMPIPASLREGSEVMRRIFGQRPVWIAASTHEGEEAAVLDAFERVRKALPEALLVLVPRHPERFEKVAALCAKRGLSIARRSLGEAAGKDTQVFLGDTLGELLMFYGASDVAFVGGSWVPVGGHNLLEPAAFGVPVLFGPHTFHTEAVASALEGKGGLRVEDSSDLAEAVTKLLADPCLRSELGEQARSLVEKNRGAVERVLEVLGPFLDQPVASAGTLHSFSRP